MIVRTPCTPTGFDAHVNPMIKTLLGALLLLSLVAALPAADAQPLPCETHTIDDPNSPLPAYAHVACGAPINGCVYYNFDGGDRRCVP